MAKCFFVYQTNAADPEYVANSKFSSENANFPLVNVYNLNRRRKTWRTSGFWNVVDGSNKIVFEETIGVLLFAIIPAGEYQSDAAFFAAIKAAFELPGSSTYTVSRDLTTNRIKIEAALGGGATVFRIKWTNGTSAGMASLLGYSTASDDIGSLSYVADLLKIHTSEFIQWDLGFPSNPNAFVALADRNKPLKLSPSAVIKLQGNHTNNFSNPSINLTLDYQDFVIGKVAQTGFGSFRYWRFVIEDQANVYGYVEFGAIFLGIPINVTRGAPVFPLEPADIDLSPVAYSEAGQTIAANGPRTQSFDIQWQGLNKESYQALADMFQVLGKHQSFLIVMDSSGIFTTDAIRSAKLVKFSADPVSRLVSPNNWSMTWTLREEL